MKLTPEQVSHDLAAALPPCPNCATQPEIWKRLTGCPPRPILLVQCPNFSGNAIASSLLIITAENPIVILSFD